MIGWYFLKLVFILAIYYYVLKLYLILVFGQIIRNFSCIIDLVTIYFGDYYRFIESINVVLVLNCGESNHSMLFSPSIITVNHR